MPVALYPHGLLTDHPPLRSHFEAYAHRLARLAFEAEVIERINRERTQ